MPSSARDRARGLHQFTANPAEKPELRRDQVVFAAFVRRICAMKPAASRLFLSREPAGACGDRQFVLLF
jgi:hypothetical protein